ncbi:Aldo/keto reductase [Pyrenochaeta sp. DS3sAY3a]|nr:Aldo/keto reductase [Pyrenochaeta sp. DS3sAY3a]
MAFGLITRNVRITLGTDKLNGVQCIEYVQRGLAAGYRSIDTAPVYMNEEAIGQAIRRSSVLREQVHVTTKISTGFKQNPSSVGEVRDLVRVSLTRLGIGYVDTVLIHHPGDNVADPGAADRLRTTWKGLEAMVEEGQVRSIGVSNFGVSHLHKMKQYARILPTVNQIELHPWCQRRKLVDYCKSENIPLQAYLAIARNSRASDQSLVALANKYNTSTVVILLCYSLRKGYVPIAKAQNPQHLVSNLEAEKLCITDEDLALMDSWDKGDEGSLGSYLDLCQEGMLTICIVPWLMGSS